MLIHRIELRTNYTAADMLAQKEAKQASIQINVENKLPAFMSTAFIFKLWERLQKGPVSN